MTQKQLQKKSKYAEYDIDGDGVVSDEELSNMKDIKETEKRLENQLQKIQTEIERIEKINTSSKEPVQGVYPGMPPLNAASWLLNNCYEESTPFFLYETCKKGIYLDSLKSMYELVMLST